MKTKMAYLFVSVFSFFLQSFSFSQEVTKVPVFEPKGYRVRAEIIDGDTIPFVDLQWVYVMAEFPIKNKKMYEQWTRTKYNVKKVYPYAILAAAKLKEYDRILETLPENQRDIYMKYVDKKLREEFGDELKDLSITQGRILLKLIDRETGKTTYDIVKQFRGGFQASLWQGVARVFGNNMKSEYDPNVEDILIERAIKLVEAGQI